MYRENPKPKASFLSLPPELRNEIYRLVLGGRTIHIHGTTGNPRKFKLVFQTCSSKDGLEPLARLTGAAHSSSTTLTGPKDWQPCNKNLIKSASDFCGQPVNLDVQLLRVCRQIHEEAALVLFSKNSFIFGSDDVALGRGFCKRFSVEKRGAMSTVAIQIIADGNVENIPAALPGLKRLWMRRFLGLCSGDRYDSLTIRSFEWIEGFKLDGIWFEQGLYCGDDQDVLEKLEMALLKQNESN